MAGDLGSYAGYILAEYSAKLLKVTELARKLLFCCHR